MNGGALGFKGVPPPPAAAAGEASGVVVPSIATGFATTTGTTGEVILSGTYYLDCDLHASPIIPHVPSPSYMHNAEVLG